MDIKTTGNTRMQENFDGWLVEMNTAWDSKKIHFVIKSRNANLLENFKKCRISRSPLISLIARYDNFNFRGEPSVISDLLLNNTKALHLLKKSKARIRLDERYLIYQARVRRKEYLSLDQLYMNIKGLLSDINALIPGLNKNFAQHR